LLLAMPPPRDCKDGGSGREPAGGAAGPPRHRPDGPGAVTLLGATGTPAWSGIPPGGRCATLTAGITPPPRRSSPSPRTPAGVWTRGRNVFLLLSPSLHFLLFFLLSFPAYNISLSLSLSLFFPLSFIPNSPVLPELEQRKFKAQFSSNTCQQPPPSRFALSKHASL